MRSEFNLQKAREDVKHANKPTYDYMEATRRCILVHMPAALARIEELEEKIESAKTDNNHCIVSEWKFGEYQKRIEELEKTLTEERATIETLKTALISDRTELVLYSPDYIVWRYHNDIDKIESQDDWKPLEVEAKAQLAREYPEIFGDDK